MVASSNSDDPRPTWRFIRRAMRVLPRWLLIPIVELIQSLILYRRREAFDNNLPTHLGVHLWLEGVNADLYQQRLTAALDLFQLHAPVYLHWFRRRLPAIVVNQMFKIMPRPTEVDLKRRVLVVRPQFAWTASPEALAVALVFQVTRARLGRRFNRKKTWVRAGKRMYAEALAFARTLPGQEELVASWERALAKYIEQDAQAAA